MRPMAVALYARVSSEQQATARTIDSQVAAVRERIAADGLIVSEELTFIDDGFSGATLVRPALERLRDSAAAGGIARLYVLAPDRLARKYAYQVLLLEELRRAGVAVIFLTQSPGTAPEDELLVQVQGMVAEYERAKILERARRGKRQGALAGSVAVIGHAPYGYRYVTKAEGGGQARYDVLLEEARVVRQIFTWVGQEHLSMGEVGRRLTAEGVPRRTSTDPWDRSLVYSICKNPAYRGAAAFGKTAVGPLRPRVRTQRGHPEVPRRPVSVYHVPSDEWLTLPVPALVSEELFAAVQEQLHRNRRHVRLDLRCTQFLVQGLAVCARCGCAYCGAMGGARCKGDPARRYGYYRCSGYDRTLRCGLPRCDNPATRGDLLDAAVWSEVARLLLEPERLRAEYERRLQDPVLDQGAHDVGALERQVQTLRHGIGRLIDSYAEGLINKEQFEPRVRRLKERIALLEADAAQEAAALAEQQSLRVVIGQLDDFVATVRDRLPDLDWETRRAILRAPVKRVDVDHTHIRVVFRVGLAPLVLHPDGTVSQDRERSHGTLLVNLTTHRVIDVLPDRTAATFAAWLRAHPEVRVITRDPSGAYADGAWQGAPQAQQIADRFHLLRNVTDAFQRHLGRHHAALRQATQDPLAVAPPAPAAPPARVGRDARQSQARRARRYARYEEVRALHCPRIQHPRHRQGDAAP